MWLVVASNYDKTAKSLVARWGDHAACLLTPADLSAAGWNFFLNRDLPDTFSVNGQIYPVREIQGVVNRLPAVYEQELIYIAQTDRPYVAAEMQAFLLAWLTALDVPMINRPSPTCLSGPGWGQMQWVYHAAKAGFKVLPFYQNHDFDASVSETEPLGEIIEVTFAGKRCFGVPNVAIEAKIKRLADLAGVNWYTVQLARQGKDYIFIKADIWCENVSVIVADTILKYFREEIEEVNYYDSAVGCAGG
jgi:hypothetical protein